MQQLKSYKLQSGLSLIELMIALAVGLIVIAGVTNIYLSTIVSSTTTLKQSKLNQELTTLMAVMSNDIMRAGITGNLDYNNPQDNVFNLDDNTALEVIDNMADNNKLDLDNIRTGGTTSGSCIVFAYDTNLANGLEDGDIVGFRLNNGAVEMREQGDVANNATHFSCDDNEDVWLPLTDSRIINVSALSFDFSNSECLNTDEPNGNNDDGDAGTNDTDEMNCFSVAPNTDDITVETRQIDITLTGQLVNDTSVNTTMTQSVRVRNDLIRIR